MATDPLPPDSLVLVLATDDSWLFVGTVTEVLDHAERHRGRGHAPDDEQRPTPRAVDFHGDRGQPLRPLLDEGLEVHGFTPADQPPAPDVVRQRIERVMTAARAHLAAHPASSDTMYPQGTVVPELSGDLVDVLRRLREEEVPPDGMHKSGWFHNLLHALG